MKKERPKLFKKIIIHRTGDVDKTPYLERTFLMITPWFRVMWHKFLISDDDCLHDHPWAFLSFIVKGGYWEWCDYDQLSLKERKKIDFTKIERRLGPDGGLQIRRRYNPGSILFRRADWKHKVEVDKPAYTLVITFKKERRWGFWPKRGWVHHSEYGSTAKCE